MCDYPGLIVHKSFDEKGGDFKACPIGTGPVRARLLRRRPEGGLQAPRRQQVVGRRGLSRRRRTHRLRHRSGRHGQRLRSGRSRTPISRPRPTMCRSSTASSWSSPRSSPPRRSSAAPTSPTSPTTTRRCAMRCSSRSTTTVVLQLGYGNAGAVAENHHVCQIHPEYYRAAEGRSRHRPRPRR